jgi:hypothetical protein
LVLTPAKADPTEWSGRPFRFEVSIMNRHCVLTLLLCLLLVGCGGGSDPVNEGKDRPVPPPKKDKDK